MPDPEHRRVAAQASESTRSRRARGLGKIRDKDAYVYSTLNKIEKRRKAKRARQRRHRSTNVAIKYRDVSS